jgi:hypothetical protein
VEWRRRKEDKEGRGEREVEGRERNKRELAGYRRKVRRENEKGR